MTATVCPARHTAYPSAEVAANAVELHLLAFRSCPGFHAWECGDHHHIGHVTPAAGEACKTNPNHRAERNRIRRALEIGRWR